MTGVHQLLFSNFSTAAANVVTQTFTGTGSWVAPAGVTQIEQWLVVAGGGGGGGKAAHGGGGGKGIVIFTYFE